MTNLIFIHGLNNNNSIWDDLDLHFRDQYQIHKIKLLGHDDDYHQLHTLTADDIIEDLAKKINNISGPKRIIAFSLGGLSFSKAHEKWKIKEIEKIIYLAPAFKVKQSLLIKTLSLFRKKSELKSVSLKEYRRYSKLPLNIYRQMIHLTDQSQKKAQDTNSLIFCSAKDPLVSMKFVKNNFKNSKVIDLNRKRTHSHPSYQHMIFNKKFLGDKWPVMIKEMGEYFEQ